MATETPPKIPTYFFSIGHRCSSSGILQNLNLKTESYPFDWIVSNLSTVRHCIETDFVEFLNPGNYARQETITANILDARVIPICNETPEINTFYDLEIKQTHIGIQKKGNTYWKALAITHHSMSEKGDVEYFKRCVSRFRERMASGFGEKKRYLYIHPFVGVYEYDFHKHAIRKEWDEFSEFMGGKMGDIRGMFIIPVFLDKGMGNREVVWEELFRSKWAVGWKVEISNWGFKDGGATFSGEYEQELRSFEAMVRREFWDDIMDKKTREDLDSVSLVFASSEKG